MLMSPVGLRSEKGCVGDALQKTEKYRPDFSSERASHINKPETVKKKKSKREWEKLVAGYRWVPDTKTDGLVD
jgi:hypothetical protein